MLTHKAKYGLRAMCVLAHADEDWAQARTIAQRAQVPEKFLEAILVDLRRAGFVRSRRGQQGGHALARPASDIRVGDLIRAIDGPLAPVRCASLSAYTSCSDCPDPEACAVRALMCEARAALASVLDTCTLQTLAGRAEREPLLEPPPGVPA
jgi:Rrf2 family protein